MTAPQGHNAPTAGTGSGAATLAAGGRPIALTMDNHFLQRCRERGLSHVAVDVYWDLRLALSRIAQGIDQDGDYIEKMFDIQCPKDNRAIYRFNVGGVIYFAMVADGNSPITLLTKSMIGVYRSKRRRVLAERRMR